MDDFSPNTSCFILQDTSSPFSSLSPSSGGSLDDFLPSAQIPEFTSIFSDDSIWKETTLPTEELSPSIKRKYEDSDSSPSMSTERKRKAPRKKEIIPIDHPSLKRVSE